MKYLILMVFVSSVSCNKPLLERNDSCVVARTNAVGVCDFIENCPSIVTEISRKSQFPTLCGFEGTKEVICCPKIENIPTTTTIGYNDDRRISAKKCDQYNDMLFEQNYIESCVTFHSLAKKFVHMASLGYDDTQTNSIKWACSGSLISENFIITAAHCLDTGELKYALLGELVSNQGRNAHSHQYNIIERIVHPNYNNSSRSSDIALLKINGSAQFSEYVQPICLQYKNISFPRAIASGWAPTDSNNLVNNTSNTQLMTFEVDIGEKSVCKTSYGNHTYAAFLDELDGNLQICAGSNVYKQDVCQGDSGGPLQIDDSYDVDHATVCLNSMIGVTSFGMSCKSGYLGVYTRILPHLEWIENIVWPEK